MILTDLRHKIKSFIGLLDRKDVYMALLIIFTAITSYTVGLLSGKNSTDTPVTIRNAGAVMSATIPPSQEKTTTIPHTSQGLYVGSKSGTKYHLPTCSGAQRISEANKVWFASKAEAEKAGYTPALNCPGI
jgi:hypothetical protein